MSGTDYDYAPPVGDLDPKSDLAGQYEAVVLQSPAMRKAGRPSKAEAERLSEYIISVASRLFFEEGVAAVSMDRLAAECGTTRRSIAHRFLDKDDLVLAVAEQGMREIDGRLNNIHIDEENPLETLRRACRAMLGIAMEPLMLSLFQLMISEVKRIPCLTETAIKWNNSREDYFERIVLQAQNKGLFQAHGAAGLAKAAVGMMLSNPANRASLGDPGFFDEHNVDLYFSQMWAVFCAMK